jgi:hypothetical protein
MTPPLPLLSRFQSLVWGAVLGSSWGLQEHRTRPTLFDVQDFWVQVSVDRSPEFLQLAQRTQQIIRGVCPVGKSNPASCQVPPLSAATIAAIESLDPWFDGLISTLLHPQSRPEPPPPLNAIHDLWQKMLFAKGPLAESLNTIISRWVATLAQELAQAHLAFVIQVAETDLQDYYSVGQFAARLSRLEVEPEVASIAIAWYCFRCTPQDLALSLTRAVQYSPHPHLAGLLTGTWSCLYNGKVIFASTIGAAYLIASIPPLPDSVIASTAISELLRSVTLLFAQWAGVLVRNETTLSPKALLTITAPRQMLHV